MKILHWANELGLGGTPKTLEQFAIYLKKFGHDCHVVCYRDGDLSRAKNLNIAGVPITTISRDGRVSEFQDIMQWGPDIVHSYRSGYPEFPEPGEHFELNGAKFVETNVFGHCDGNPYIDKTLYMSEYLQFFAQKYSKRYDFINNPIPKPSNDYMQYDQFKDGKINIGRTGRPENGIYDPISLDAINYLFSIRPDLRDRVRFLALAPPPNMIKDLEKYKIDYHIISPTVDNEEIFRFYNSIHICAHARLDGETCGNSIQEAMMHGVAVVTHISEPGVPDICPFQAQCFLVENGFTGYVSDHCYKAYAYALMELIDNPSTRKKLGNAGREKALREFETGICVTKLEKIYMEILSGGTK